MVLSWQNLQFTDMHLQWCPIDCFVLAKHIIQQHVLAMETYRLFCLGRTYNSSKYSRNGVLRIDLSWLNVLFTNML